MQETFCSFKFIALEKKLNEQSKSLHYDSCFFNFSATNKDHLETQREDIRVIWRVFYGSYLENIK